jgi:outer membrane protein OmpA-like peptidoglycan-associated protein
LLATLAAVAALAGMGLLGYWFAETRDDASTVAGDDAETAVDDRSTGSSLAADTVPDPGQQTTTPPASSVPTSTTQDDDDPDEDPAPAGLDNRDGSIRHAVFKNEQVYLRGRVPSQEIADEIAAKAGAVVGPDNVIVEYEIDPQVPIDLPSPLYVEDVVLFDFNSIEIEPGFLPILDLGTLLLVQNPNVTITVVAKTDATGPAEVNMEVSEQRAQAVIDYWVRKGIDPSRLIADARGETEASEDDDEETAALHRRAEFVIEGLLG